MTLERALGVLKFAWSASAAMLACSSNQPATDSGCVADVDGGTAICNAFSIGKGNACDECVANHCIATNNPQDKECCARGTACADPHYEYRIMIASCIAQSCSTLCGVSCEQWPHR
jgi:hypothetical protein